MSHRFKKKAPNTAVYRHFAVITVVCTALLAVFAEGPNTQAVARPVAEGRPENEAQMPAPAREAVPSPNQTPGGIWGSESDIGSFASPPSLGSFAPDFQAGMLGAYQPELMARLSPLEREELLRSMAFNGADGSGTADERTTSLEDASRRRSGSLGLE